MATTTTATAASQPDRLICTVAVDGGVYYLLLVSAADHNFSACASNPEFSYDALFAISGIDRRCFFSDQFTVDNHATGGVYSDGKAANLAAAHAFCDANGTE